jgi:predicted PurR-regulated permease PerM
MTDPLETPDAESAPTEPAPVERWNASSIAVWGIFILLALCALYLARSVALPVALAGLASLVLTPIVKAGSRVGVPPALVAGLLLLALLGGLGYGGVALSGPASEWIQRAPESAREVERKLRFLREPVARVSKATKEVERATQLGGEPREAVVVDRPKLSDVLFAQTQEFVVGLLMTGVLLFFLLSAPDSFLEKLVSLAPRLQDKKRVVAAVREVESEVSRYLIAISAINAVFGLAVGAALYGIGVPNAALWGVLAMLTNFVPYVGALAMAIVLTAVGVLSFEAPSQMFLPMGVFVGLNVVEANLVTPMLVGRTLTLSPVVVFVWVLLWSWLWGIPGGLIAVPLLATTKIVLQHIPPVAPLARMMD